MNASVMCYMDISQTNDGYMVREYQSRIILQKAYEESTSSILYYEKRLKIKITTMRHRSEVHTAQLPIIDLQKK